MLYVDLQISYPAMPFDWQIVRMIKEMSYLATGLNLLLRLLLWLLGNHGRRHILSCILGAHRLLIEEP